MPYDSTQDLPKQVSHLTSKEKRAYKKAYNSASDQGQDEATAHKIAWKAAKQSGERSPSETTKKNLDEMVIEGEIAKIDDDHRQVFGWASVTELNGEPVVDLQNDYLETMELEKAAYDYVLHSRVGGEMHQRVGKSSPKQVGTLIESMVLTPEKIEKMGLPDSTPRGWWIGFQVSKDETGDEVWKSVKDGKYSGFSIHGAGRRKSIHKTEIGKRVLDRSPEEIQGWVSRMAKEVGTDPAQLVQDMSSYFDQNGIEDPDDDDLHEFLMATYGDGNVGVAKHLMGRHEQKDHGRKDHNTAEGAMEGIQRGAGAGLLGGAAFGAATGGAPGALMGTGAAVPGAAIGGILGAFKGAREGGKKAERQNQRQTKIDQRIKEGAFREGASGDMFKDAQKFGNFSSDGAVMDDYSKWSKKKYGEVVGGSSETAEYMIDRGFWRDPPKTKPKVKKYLLTKAAERASTMQEFVDNIEEIGKALKDVSPGDAAYFENVHKHLIGSHEQKDHGRKEHGSKKDPNRISNKNRAARAVSVPIFGGIPMAASAIRGTTIFDTSRSRRKAKNVKKFTDRQIEVLEKYLGVGALDQDGVTSE